MLFQGSEGLTKLRLTGVLTPLKRGTGEQPPHVPEGPQGWRGGPGSAEGVKTALPAACCCLGWAPLRLHRRYLPNYSYFPAVGRIWAQIPQSQLSLSLPAHWGGSTVSPSLPAAPQARPSRCLPRARTRQGTPHFTPAKCFKDKANTVPAPQGDTCAGWTGGAPLGVPALPRHLRTQPLSPVNPTQPGCPFPHQQARP